MTDSASATVNSAEEALQRAKNIAARLQQQNNNGSIVAASTHSNQTTWSGNKRRRWGLAPDDAGSADNTTTTTTTATSTAVAVAFAATAPIVEAAAKRAKTPTSTTTEPTTKLSKRLWISTSAQRPAAHYVNFLKDLLEHELPQKVNPSSSSVDGHNNAVTAALQGRGSDHAKKHAIPGVPLEPLHVLIQATTQDLLSQAELWVDDWLQKAEEAEVHPDLLANLAGNDDNAAAAGVTKSITSTSLALATIQDPTASLAKSSAAANYRPASVAQLIHGGGDAVGGGGAGGTGDWIDEVVPVPVGVVGFIIGKGGENIASLQARTGARVQVQRDNSTNKTEQTTHRNIHVAAATREALEQCKALIQATVQEKSKLLSSHNSSAGGGSGSGGGGVMSTTSTMMMNRKDAQRLEEALAAGHFHLKLPVPDEDVGLIIGKGGSTIRQLQDKSGANIQVPSAQEVKDGKRTVHITHPNQAGAEHAQRLIQELLQNNAHHKQQQQQQQQPANGGANHNATAASINTTEPHVTATMMIPDADVGLIIGRQGCVIRYLQDSTRCKIQIPPHCVPTLGGHTLEQYRHATITGPAAGCIHAQQMMQQIISDQSSAGVMALAPPTAGGEQGAGSYGHGTFSKRQVQETPQQPYSAEWAAYYAAQQAAAAIQPNSSQSTSPQLPTLQQQPPYTGGYGYHHLGSYPPQHQHQPPWGAAPVPAGAAAAASGGSNGPTAAPAAPAAAQTSPTPAAPQPVNKEAYYEQFFRYAYYYGEPAARMYYGAWAPPLGTKNPYGANPNGVQPAPVEPTSSSSPGEPLAVEQQNASGNAAVAAGPRTMVPAEQQVDTPNPLRPLADPAVSGQQHPQQLPRETSVRKVSNLPAWMNNKT